VIDVVRRAVRRSGVRIVLGARVFIAPEFRLGWEPEARATVMIGLHAR
jgi:hypothetical protein